MCHKCEEVRNGTDDGSLLDRCEAAMQDQMMTARIKIMETHVLAEAVLGHLPASHHNRAYWQAIFNETSRLNDAMQAMAQKMLDVISVGMNPDRPAKDDRVN